MELTVMITVDSCTCAFVAAIIIHPLHRISYPLTKLTYSQNWLLGESVGKKQKLFAALEVSLPSECFATANLKEKNLILHTVALSQTHRRDSVRRQTNCGKLNMNSIWCVMEWKPRLSFEWDNHFGRLHTLESTCTLPNQFEELHFYFILELK